MDLRRVVGCAGVRHLRALKYLSNINKLALNDVLRKHVSQADGDLVSRGSLGIDHVFHGADIIIMDWKRAKPRGFLKLTARKNENKP